MLFPFLHAPCTFECHKLLQAITEKQDSNPANSLVENTFPLVSVTAVEQLKRLKLFSEVELAYGQKQNPNRGFLIFTQG